MPNPPTDRQYTNLEIHMMFNEIKTEQALHTVQNEAIIKRVDYTNGKLRRLTFYLTIVATVTATLLFTNGSELLTFILKII